jgi:ribulose-5-phosphate 4-epimerase/fuculose-1-phosphate aldolase
MTLSAVTRRGFLATLATSTGAAALYATEAGAAALAQGGPSAPPDPGLIADLVAGNHILVRKGVVQINGHLSARHPGNSSRFFLARAIAPETVTAADIMEFDLESNAIDARGRLPYTERFIHSEIYKARPDVMGVVHAHTPSVLPFATSDIPLRPVYQQATFIGDSVPVYKNGDRGEVVSNVEQAQEMVRVLGSGAVVLMHGHGVVVVAPSVRTVVSRCIELELNARILQNILAMGGKPTYLRADAPGGRQGGAGRQGGGGRQGGRGGVPFDRDWEAWLQEEKRIMSGR